MAVLITGASGFVGLALTEALLADGQSVIGLDAAPLPEAALVQFATLPGHLRSLVADACDAPAVAAAMEGADRMVIAAAVTAGEAREAAAPEGVIAVNVQAVATAVRLAAAAGLQRVVQVSSVAAYGAVAETAGPLTEDMPCPPGRAVWHHQGRWRGGGAPPICAGGAGPCGGPARQLLRPVGACDGLARYAQSAMANPDRRPPWRADRAGRGHGARLALCARCSGGADGGAACAVLAAPGLQYRQRRDMAAFGVVRGADAGPGLAGRAAAAYPQLGPASARLHRAVVADTAYRPRFGAAEAAADWLGFLQRGGGGSLMPRATMPGS